MNAVRAAVRELLQRSPAFAQLPADRRRELAHDVVHVASRLADPARLIAAEFRTPLLSVAEAGRGGIASFDSLVAAADFPEFVRRLIQGVFGAIVNMSIKQMEAYAQLLKRVSDSVDQFMRDNLDEDAARDWLAESFPDLFCVEATTLTVKADAMAMAWSRLNKTLRLRQRATAADLKRIVQAARRRLARARQQQLATMLMMGINRIVVTDGRSRVP